MTERGSSEGQRLFLRRRGAFSAANPQACGLILRNLFRVKPSVPLLTQRTQSLGRSTLALLPLYPVLALSAVTPNLMPAPSPKR